MRSRCQQDSVLDKSTLSGLHFAIFLMCHSVVQSELVNSLAFSHQGMDSHSGELHPDDLITSQSPTS